MESSFSPAGAAVSATGFGVRGPRGWAFRDITFEAEPGALVAVEGPSGSGRTCLLLALTGRMRARAGHAEVAGLRLAGSRRSGSGQSGSGRSGSRQSGTRRPHCGRTGRMAAVRRLSALGPVPGVSELEPSLTVAEHLRERALLQRRFGGSPLALLRPRAERAADLRERTDTALRAAGFDPDTLPKGARTAVRDLDRLESLRLSVALALVARPRLLAVDDLDLKLSPAERAQAWETLRGIAAAGTTVLAVCGEAPEDAVRVRTGADDRTAQQPEKTGAEDPAPPQDRTDRTDPEDHTPPQDRRAEDPAPPQDRTDTEDHAPPPERTGADHPTPQPGPPRGDDEDGSGHDEDGNRKGAAADALAETGRA